MSFLSTTLDWLPLPKDRSHDFPKTEIFRSKTKRRLISISVTLKPHLWEEELSFLQCIKSCIVGLDLFFWWFFSLYHWIYHHVAPPFRKICLGHFFHAFSSKSKSGDLTKISSPSARSRCLPPITLGDASCPPAVSGHQDLLWSHFFVGDLKGPPWWFKAFNLFFPTWNVLGRGYIFVSQHTPLAISFKWTGCNPPWHLRTKALDRWCDPSVTKRVPWWLKCVGCLLGLEWCKEGIIPTWDRWWK